MFLRAYMVAQTEGEGKMERVMGIEPTFSAWEADVLPLNYTRMGVAADQCLYTRHSAIVTAA